MPCPDGQHEYKEEGIGVTFICERSAIRWKKRSKETLLGITTSSHSSSGAVEVTNYLKIKSSITVCQKCRSATGPALAILSLAALKLIVEKYPHLKILLDKAERCKEIAL